MNLLERDHELVAANRALRAAATGRGGLVVVTGPPGAGRSALLASVCESPAAAGFTVLRAAAAADERQFAFGVVQQLFQSLLGASTPAQVEAWLGGPAGPARGLLLDDPWSAGHAPAETILHALHALLLNVGEDRPVLLAVDDVHWADPASLTWLGYLSRRLKRARVLVLCAVTTQESADDRGPIDDLLAAAADTLRPAPLSRDAARRLLQAERTHSAVARPAGHRPRGPTEDGDGPDVADGLVALCHEVTGGRPAAVAAVVPALRAFGSATADLTSRNAIAGRVAGSVTADLAAARELCHRALRPWRLACLVAAPPAARRLSEAMVVLGEQATPDVLRDLARLDGIAYAAALRTLDRAGLLASAAPPRFVHPSVPTSLAASMSRGTRERLHRAAAKALHATGEPAERVGEHLLQAGAGLDRWAIDILRSAAGAVAERGAAGQAARFLRAALLDNPAAGRRRARLLADLAAVERDTDPLSCAQRISDAVPFLEPGPERAAAVLLVPVALAATVAPVAELIHRTAAELAERDPAGRHRDLALRLEARVRRLALLDRTAPEPHVQPVRERIHELLVAGASDTGAGRELLAVLGWASAVTGALPSAEIASIVGSVVESEPADSAHVHTALPVLLQAALAVDAADAIEPWLDRAMTLANDADAAGVRGCLAAEQAYVLAGTGRLERARKIGVDLLATADSAWPATRAFAMSALTTVALQTQDTGLAELLLAARWPQDDHRMGGRRMLRGMVDALTGDLPAALEGFLGVGRELTRNGSTGPACPPWRVWAAMVHERLGQHDQAVALAEAELRAATGWGGPTPLGRALRLLGTLTPGEPGIVLLREAVGVHRLAADRLELARSAVVLGRQLRTARQPDAAHLIEEGERLARQCDAAWREGSPDAEIAGPVPRLLRSGRDRLSPAEDTVVALVLRGWSNARIADELKVTRRAVEKHLTSVYRKLGVSGRAALAQELAMAAPNRRVQS